MKHALHRTSPKGQPFIGTCTQCGRAGLTWDDFTSDECENPRGLSEDYAVLEAVDPPEQKAGK